MSMDARLKRLEALLRAKEKTVDAGDLEVRVRTYIAARREVFGDAYSAEKTPELRAWRDYLAGDTGAPPERAKRLLDIAPLDILRKIEAVVERLEIEY
ncbi:hypothetical protein [Ralstonia pseudosolanacearum]